MTDHVKIPTTAGFWPGSRALVLLAALLPGGGEAMALQSTSLGPAGIAREAGPSVVMIETPGGTGSGVILTSSGVIVTSLHVVQGETEITVRLANGDIFEDVGVADVDVIRDIVLLKLEAFGLPTAVMGDSDTLAVGDPVVVIAAPRGFDQSVTTGILSAVRDSGEGYRVFQTDAAASPGSSGGGMFNSRGELVGIVSAKASDAENVNFALPGNYVRGLTGAETVMTLHDLARLYPDPEREPSVDPLADGVAAEVLPGLIAESAFEFESLGESIWGIPYIGGDHLEEVFVSVSAYGDLVLTQAFIVDPPELGAETMRRLLRLNYDRDLVKIGIDGVGDLAILNETEAELLDAFGLERIADAVATVTDDAAGIVGAGDPTAASGPKLSENLGSLRLRDRNARESMDLLEGVTLSVDPNAWHVRRPLESGTNVWEYVEGDVYFTVIAERLEFPHDVMRDVVVENAMRTAEEARITRYGFREVNGVELMWLEMDARLSGIDFTYFTHVYSGAAGTVQLHAWTSRSLLGEYRETIEEMVAGFEVR